MKKILTLCAVSTLALSACSSNDEVMYENASPTYKAHTARVEAEQAPYKVSREVDETAPLVGSKPAEPAPAPVMEETAPVMEPIMNQADRQFDDRLTKGTSSYTGTADAVFDDRLRK